LSFYETEISAAREERRQAGAWQNPEVSTEFGRKRVRGDVSAEGTARALSASQTFEWLGRVSLRKAIANQQVQLAEAGLEQFRVALVGQVRQKAYAAFVAQPRGRPIAEQLIITDPALSFPELPSMNELIRRAARGNLS
jgi:cobalt-zinc-cadmium efflux system outer membrane protein